MSNGSIRVLHNENWIGSTTHLEVIMTFNRKNYNYTFPRSSGMLWRREVRRFMGNGFAEGDEPERRVNAETTAKLMLAVTAYASFTGSADDKWMGGLNEAKDIASLVIRAKGN